MIKAIVFDCDGMVVDSDRFSTRSANEFGTSTGLINDFFRTTFQECIVGRADLRQELSKVLRDWKWERTVDELLAYWFDPKHNVINGEMKDIVESLRQRGIKTYLATNNEKYRTQNLFVERGLNTWFDGVFSSGFIGHKKPEPEFFQSIVDQSGELKENILFCDDDEENIAGARAFGLQTFFYKNMDDFKKKTSAIQIC